MDEKELENMLVDEGDLLFARQSLVLSGAGKCSIVKSVDGETTFESHIIRVRLKRDIAHPNFFYYYFNRFITSCWPSWPTIYRYYFHCFLLFFCKSV